MQQKRRGDDHGGRGGDTPLVLVVEDDRTISDLVAYNLRRAGFTVRQERSGTGGLEAAMQEAPDLVLLDLMLPGLDGVSTAREIRRRRPTVPIIMLTAKDDRETMLRGFEAGADDYVTKPFDMDLLLARMQARLRSAARRDDTRAGRRLLDVGDLRLDHDRRSVTGPRGSVALKPKEYDLLELLLDPPDHLRSREALVEGVWHHRYLPGSRSLDVHVLRLRRRLEEVGSRASIETVRGVGYRVVTETVGRPAPADDEAGG